MSDLLLNPCLQTSMNPNWPAPQGNAQASGSSQPTDPSEALLSTEIGESTSASGTLTLEEDAVISVLNLLRDSIGVDFTHYKRSTILRRLGRRMSLHRIEQITNYWRYLQENPAELPLLYQELLINVTSFFRNAPVFEALKQSVFPSFLQNCQTDEPIRIWIAGCSTGQEAYSIAIGLLEFLTEQPHQPPIQIFATDVSESAINQARLGIYQHSQVTDVSPERLQRFFTPIEGGYQIQKFVRERCIFARQNLISDPPFSQMDLISCRNVFIYFRATLQKKVLSMFHYGLKPTGFLLLGNSETVGDSPDLFRLVDQKVKIYTKQPSTLRFNLDFITRQYATEIIMTQPLADETNQMERELHQAADQIILQQYGPVGVVINSQLEILQFRGQTGAYLELAPGRASLNLLNMAKEELRLELQTAIYQAQQAGKSIWQEFFVPDEKNVDSDRQVCIDVIPFQPAANAETFFLVLFREMPNRAIGPVNAANKRRTASKQPLLSREQQEIQRLQQELNNTKAYLQAIIAEQQSTNQDLRVANEEILSSNEELQSTNEELQTAKEEIQATNEELSTINDELYRRNREAIQVSNDFQNLLGSINIPILMVEGNLNIRRFTPTAVPLFNLISSDIGRPLSDIKHNLQITDLDAQILEVINTLNLKTQEVQDHQGHWYDLRIRPYRTIDNRIDGAVVVLVEIDALKKNAERAATPPI